MESYIFLLALFPLVDVESVSSGSEVEVPCYPERCGKYVEVHACPAVGVTCLQFENEQSYEHS